MRKRCRLAVMAAATALFGATTPALAAAEYLLHSLTAGAGGSTANPEGSAPISAPVPGPDGALSGPAFDGGAHAAGTVYRIDASGTFTVPHSFDALSDDPASGASNVEGANPRCLTLTSDGHFYGINSDGGAYGRQLGPVEYFR